MDWIIFFFNWIGHTLSYFFQSAIEAVDCAMTGSLADYLCQSAADYWVLFLAYTLVFFLLKEWEKSSCTPDCLSRHILLGNHEEKMDYFRLFWYTTDYGGFISNTHEDLVIFKWFCCSCCHSLRLSICTVKSKISGDTRAREKCLCSTLLKSP